MESQPLVRKDFSATGFLLCLAATFGLTLMKLAVVPLIVPIPWPILLAPVWIPICWRMYSIQPPGALVTLARIGCIITATLLFAKLSRVLVVPWSSAFVPLWSIPSWWAVREYWHSTWTTSYQTTWPVRIAVGAVLAMKIFRIGPATTWDWDYILTILAVTATLLSLGNTTAVRLVEPTALVRRCVNMTYVRI